MELLDMKVFIFFMSDIVFFGILLRTILPMSEKLTKREYLKVEGIFKGQRLV